MRSMERDVTTWTANAPRVCSLPLSPGVAQARQRGLSKNKIESTRGRSGGDRRGGAEPN
ncbi:MAG: hypothetical protein WB760_34845 [Xanthobacteraceae bacterium]